MKDYFFEKHQVLTESFKEVFNNYKFITKSRVKMHNMFKNETSLPCSDNQELIPPSFPCSDNQGQIAPSLPCFPIFEPPPTSATSAVKKQNPFLIAVELGQKSIKEVKQ